MPLLCLLCLWCLVPALRPHAEHDADWDDKKHRLGAKMLKLRGMLGQLRQAASSESENVHHPAPLHPLANPLMSHLQMQASAGRQRMLCAVGCVAHCLAGALKQPTGQELYDQARGIYIKQKHWYQSKVGQPGSQGRASCTRPHPQGGWVCARHQTASPRAYCALVQLAGCVVCQMHVPWSAAALLRLIHYRRWICAAG
jgi:hypothetical protein